MYKVTKPTLLLDKKKAIRNIEAMAKKANASGVNYRPHFKTHFSKEIGEWYREQGVKSITVSSIDMAVYFAGQGWNDITIAFPANILQVDVLKHLAKQVRLGLVVESIEVAKKINDNLESPVGIYIKIDTGYHRVGIWHENTEEIKAVIDTIEEPHEFMGLLAHFGHTYKETDSTIIEGIYHKEVNYLKELKGRLGVDGIISVGDTPSCSVVSSFKGVDEIRPGNLVFYDVMQAEIGSCNFKDIAICLATPVVAIYAERSEIVVHGGAVHLSKDRLIDENGNAFYGKVVSLDKKGWSEPLSGFKVTSLSQEHGKISIPKDQISNIKIGDLFGILPIHSCLTANLMKEYMTLRSDKIGTMHG